MGKMNLEADQSKKVSALQVAFVVAVVMLSGCAHQKPQLNATQYRFTINDEAYRIRSISTADKVEAYNELIAGNFVAVDFDQDRVIDRILIGDVSLAEAQKIYDFGLERVTRENKLIVRVPSDQRYVYENCGLHLEIRSFRPADTAPFNEFRIVDQRQVVSPPIVVIVDHHADGILDAVLKGSADLEKAQSQYAEVIAAGLQKGKLTKINGTILVTEKKNP